MNQTQPSPEAARIDQDSRRAALSRQPISRWSPLA